MCEASNHVMRTYRQLNTCNDVIVFKLKLVLRGAVGMQKFSECKQTDFFFIFDDNIIYKQLNIFYFL